MGCGVIGGAFGVVSAEVVSAAYPGYSGANNVKVVASMRDEGASLRIQAYLSGLEPSATGGIHVHSGFTCSSDGAVTGGHYVGGLPADPWTTTYTSDASGAAFVDLTVADFSLEGTRPVAGRTLVVHLSGGTRAACGIITPSLGEVASIGTYPGLTGPARGMVLVHPTSTGIHLTGLLTGLEASASGGYHVHRGHGGCASADGVDGGGPAHYYESGSDPWTGVVYSSDSTGSAFVSESVGGFSLYESLPVYGRSVVVHSSGGSRVGCGVIGTTSSAYAGAVESFSAYPGYSGGLSVRGMLSFESSSSTSAGSSSLRIRGVIAGLEASSSGGWHVHAGFGCSQSSGSLSAYPGGHFYDGLSSDPWVPIAYSADGSGLAVIDVSVPDFTMAPGGVRTVTGRTVVVHDSGGTRVACGVITPYAVGHADVVSIGAYPGYTGATKAVGILLEKPTGRVGMHFSGIFAGLQPSVSGGWHVHTGASCAEDGAVGGHYYEQGGSDAWSSIQYTADSSGVAVISQPMVGYSLFGDTLPVHALAVVVHLSDGTKAGCGQQELTVPVLPPPPPAPPLSPSPPAAPPPFSTTFTDTTRHASVSFASYPGQSTTVRGTLLLQAGANELRVFGFISGLTPSSVGSYSVYDGHGCGSTGEVGATYPWNGVKYTADAKGVARITLVMPGHTLNDESPVMGRPFVIGAADSLGASAAPVACGIVTPTDALATEMRAYPGSAGTVEGLLTVDDTSSGVRLRGTLSGLPASTSGGWHVHSGYSCDDAAGVFGHYFAAGGADPWTAVTYTSDSSGVAQLDVSMSNFSMYDRDAMPVFGRTGERATEDACCACGVLRRAACCVCACCCASCVHAPFL